MASNYKLKLKRFGVSNVQYSTMGTFRLRVEAMTMPGFTTDPNVFLLYRLPTNPYDGSAQDLYYGVASPVDMAEYPIGEPNNTTTYPFFRLNYIEVDLRSITLLDQLWEFIKKQISALLQAMDTLDDKLELEEEILVGEVPGGEESDSLFSSGSAP
jgi:hypothetical protein